MVTRAGPRTTDYLGVLGRYKVMIAGLVFFAVVISLAVTLARGPKYRATAQILVVPSADAAVAGAAASSPPDDPLRVLASELHLLTGPVVHAEVERTLGPSPAISASAPADSNIIRIRAESDNAVRAAAIANAYARAYIDVRLATANAAATAASRPIQDRIAVLQAQIARATGQQRIGLIKTQAAFEHELSQLQVDGAVHNAETRLLSTAVPPGSPILATLTRTTLWALVVGLVFGLAAAFFRDYRDDSIKSDEEFRTRWPDLSVWGLIPPVTHPTRGRREPPAVHEPFSPAGEAYQSLANVIRSRDLATGGRVLQITSPRHGAGTTTTVANLGAVLSLQGRRVAIVDCDLRRPRLGELFDLEAGTGLTSVIARQIPLNDTIRSVVDLPLLVVLPAGPIPPNPAELLASERTTEILRSLKGAVDVVLLDCPPVVGATDSVVVAARADATLLVCRAGVTTHQDVSQTVTNLRLGGASVAGVVLLGPGDADDKKGSPRPRRRRRARRTAEVARVAGSASLALLAFSGVGMVTGSARAAPFATVDGPCGAQPCATAPPTGPCDAIPCSTAPPVKAHPAPSPARRYRPPPVRTKASLQ